MNDQIKQVTALEEEKNSTVKASERIINRLKCDIGDMKDKLSEVEKQFKELDAV